MDFGKAYNRTEFVNFLRRDFLPEDFEQQQQNLSFYTKPQFATSAVKLGKSPSLDLVVYEIRHLSKNDARVGLSKDAFRLLASEKQSRALVIFVPDDTNDNYRFSLIEISLTLADDDSRVTRTYSNPRRFSYYLGKGIATYTPNKYLNELGRVSNVKDLFERFSVEVLTKAFYNELSDWYAWAIKIIKLPNDIRTTEDDQKYNHEGAIRLITRLIFVWFLKQRGLIPWQFFDQQYIADYLIEGFNPQTQDNLFGKSEASHYYKAILQNLFFAMLNSPICKEGSKEIDQRRFSRGREDFDNNKLMRYKFLFKDPDLFLKLANEHVPFLNGGLFDCLDDKRGYMYYDGFSERRESQAQLCVPDYLFFGEEAGKNIDLSEFYGDANKKKVSARGIIDILKRYNFTVEENMPFDKDVSLDPELLGKVFENLLASYNPETQQTARKQTGSFYTPREIVQYMVDESLVAHLKRTVSPELEKEYRKLLSFTDEEINLSESQKAVIMQSLYNCKILDPACGSGAFPVGILQQMVHVLTQIDPDNSRWKEMLFRLANDESSEAFKNSTPEERQEQLDDLYRSFNDNYNRPDYSRKLYLIENCIYGVDIQPIAIQISKLRFFISLVIDQNINDDPTDNFGIRPLPNLEAKFVAANSLVGLKREGNIFDTDSIKEKETLLKIAKHKIFGAKTSRTKEKYREQVRSLRGEIANMLIDQKLVGNDQAQQLNEWDMFDQNTFAPFFDPEWMFGIKEGFDIVIANPPYVEAKKLKEVVAPIKDLYKVYSGTADLSIYFIERGLNLLVQNGVLTYITTNKFFNTGYGKKLRQLLLDNDIHKIINFEQVEVFENVLVSSVVLEVGKQKSLIEEFVYEKFYKLNYKEFRPVFAGRKQSLGSYKKTYLDEKEWSFADTTGLALKAKIEFQSCLLGEIPGVSIYRGVTTGYNPAFIIDTSQKDYLISLDFNNEVLIKNLLQGRNIRKWFFRESDEHLIFTRRGVVIDKYPHIKQHLIKFHNQLQPKNDSSMTEGRKPGNYQWYEILDNTAYHPHFEKDAKIVWGLTADKWAYTIDEEQHYLPSNGYILTSSDIDIYYILAILNSKLMEHYFHYIGVMTAGGAYTLKAATISALPFKIAKDMTAFIDLVKKILSTKYNDNNADVSVLESRIDIMVYNLYGLTYDEVLVVDPQPPFSREDYDNFSI